LALSRERGIDCDSWLDWGYCVCLQQLCRRHLIFKIQVRVKDPLSLNYSIMVITGVIRPPPEIRAVADRTASYVAKNGRAFEARILKSEKGKTPKFAFLQPTSPFHAYYEDRIHFYSNGGDDEEKEEKEESVEQTESKNGDANKNTTKKTPKETVRKKEKNQKASAIDPVAKALLAQRAKLAKAKEKLQKPEGEEQKQNHAHGHGPAQPLPLPPPPPPLELVRIVAPYKLSPAHLEAIQLAAQFAALDGKGGHFLHQLTLKEWNNPEFAFLQPRHSHFAYFSSLVDAYRRIFGTWTASTNTDKTNASDHHVQSELEEAAYRAEYKRELEQQKSNKEDGEIMAIDWHDFVVVETIDFPVNEVVELSMLPPPPPPPPTSNQPTRPRTSTSTDTSPPKVLENAITMDESDDEEEETIRVVPSYTPKVVGPANPQSARAIDPITGKSVSVADMPEHMRIQLLDPKWAEERKKFQEKQKDSNLVSGDAVASNISRFAQARGDLFGKSVSTCILFLPRC
jgi:splicing factor 3A subunit 1